MLRKALATALVGAAAIGLWSQPAFGKGKPAPTTQESPAARARHAFASDGDDRLYLFGGVSYADGVRFFNDLWYYKVATHKWTEIKPAGGRSTKAPGGRTFAGWSCSGNECVLEGGYYSGGVFADSWVFTLSTGAWSKLDCSSGACPPARYGAAQAYDHDNSSHVLFGGRDASTPPHTALGDTYTFAAGAWTRHGPSSAPSPRSWAGATFVPGRGVAIFGGLGDTRISTQDATLGDLWIWDGSNWHEVAQTGGPRLSRPSIAWVSSDPRDLRLVVVGGYLSDNSWNQDTWYFRFKPGATLEGTWQEVDGHGSCQSSGGASTDIYPESMMALDIATQMQVFFGGTDPATKLQVGSTVECY